MMEVSAYANTLLQRNEPWKVWKTAPESTMVQTVMNLSLQIAAALSVLVQPFLPFTAAKLRQLLRLEPLQAGDFEALQRQFRLGKGIVADGHQIGQPELLFAKINDRKDKSRLALIERQQEKINLLIAEQEQAEKVLEPFKANCTFEDFIKVDLRVGTILTAEKIKKSKKLLKLTVDLGLEQRTVVSGIALHHAPEAVVGQQVVVVANLAPRKMMGIESQGMILMTENAEGKLLFVEPQASAVNGTPIL